MDGFFELNLYDMRYYLNFCKVYSLNIQAYIFVIKKIASLKMLIIYVWLFLFAAFKQQ